MGLLKLGGKKSENTKPKEVKESKKRQKKGKEKKSLFGGKKKEQTLLERMQLEESVAAASLDVVQELADLGGSAVRELEDGLLIVAVTNDMLEEADLDPAGEEFGSFAQALRSETIESIALADDLAAGVIGIIPSQETLLAMDEFEFVRDMPFRWALVPFDLSDDDRLTVLDSTVHIDRLVEMSNNPDIQLVIKNGEVAEVDGESDESYAPTYESQDEGVSDDAFEEEDAFDDGLDTEFDEDPSFDDEELDADFDAPVASESYFDDEPEGGFDDEFEDQFDEDYEETDELPLSDMDDENDLSDDEADYGVEEEGMTAEESKEAIHRLAAHGFNNTELDLTIDMAKFDDYFDSVSIAHFDTDRTDDSELQNILSKLRQDANSELDRFHQDNVQSLRNKFTTSMRNIQNKLVESLDHKDENTTYGRRHYEIEADYDEAIQDLDRKVAGEVDQINQAYHESREEYAENAKREALAVYDSRYRDERNRKIDGVKDTIQSDLKTTRDTEIGELYSDRRTVAQRLFDKATTSLLQNLQEEYQAISQKELQMYDAFRKNMDAYLRKHFADEVLRAKAEAEKLKQSHEAERVRKEYDQMLMTKTRQLEEADQKARDSIRQLEATHKEQIEHVKTDYDRRIEREKTENQSLREMLQDANASNSKIGEQKDKEVEHLLRTYENTIKAKEKELEYANERTKKASKPMGIVIGAVAFATLALGIIFGFLFGANSMEIAPAPSNVQTQAEQSVSYNDATPSIVTDTVQYEIAS